MSLKNIKQHEIHLFLKFISLILLWVIQSCTFNSVFLPYFLIKHFKWSRHNFSSQLVFSATFLQLTAKSRSYLPPSNQEPILHFFFFKNHFHLEVRHNMEENICCDFHFITTLRLVISISLIYNTQKEYIITTCWNTINWFKMMFKFSDLTLKI